MTRRDSTSFFSLLPRPAVVIFFMAVFLTFAPLSLLLSSSFAQQRPFVAVLFNWLISGALAVCWAGTRVMSRWFIAGIVGFSLAMMAFCGPWRHTLLGTHSNHVGLETLASALAIAGGYALFIVFIAGRGREALRLQAEMSLARQIHETLVPPLAGRVGAIEVRGVSLASSEMGGDLIDLVRHGDATDLYLADVSGHGVRAGVVMGMVKSAIRTRLLAGGDLGAILTDLNRVLHETTSPEMFVTLACLRVREGSTRIEYALAGHHPILYYAAGGGEAVELTNDAMPLGVVDDETYSVGTIDAGPGGLLVIYTDGLNECRSAAGVELGHAALRETVDGRAGDGLESIERAVLERVRQHGSAEDDQTLMLVRVG